MSFHSHPKTGKDLLTAFNKVKVTHDNYSSTFIDEHRRGLINAHGKVMRGDFITIDKSIALDHLYGFIRHDKLHLESGGPRSRAKARKWDFRRSLHLYFDKTLEDVLSAFLTWATVTVDSSGENLINVSRAFRRIEIYSDWLEDEADVLDDFSLDFNLMRQSESKYNRLIQHNYDGVGRCLLWMDVSPDAMSEIMRDFSAQERFKFLIWKTHSIMFDHNAQVNGVIFTRNAAFLGFDKIFDLMSEMWPRWIKLQFSASSIKYVKVLTFSSPFYLRMYLGSMLKFANRSTSFMNEVRKDNGLVVLRKLKIAQCIPEDFGDYSTAQNSSKKRHSEQP